MNIALKLTQLENDKLIEIRTMGLQSVLYNVTGWPKVTLLDIISRHWITK